MPREPLAFALRARAPSSPAAVVAAAAAALLDLPPLDRARDGWAHWLAPHQVPAAERLAAIIARYGGALLADAVGLGKSFVALAVARSLGGPIVLVSPAVLVPQWRALLSRFEMGAVIITHEALSRSGESNHLPRITGRDPHSRFFVVDEAHRFRHPETNRYRALAKLAIGARVLLVTATPVHNRIGDLYHLFRLFVRDHALAELGIPSLVGAARGRGRSAALGMVAARLMVARSRSRVHQGYPQHERLKLQFPDRAEGLFVRAAPAPARVLGRLVAGIRTLGGPAESGPLFRLMLFRRLASSLPALRTSLRRYRAFLEVSRDATRQGRTLTPTDFERLFPRCDDGDLQLAFLPLLLESGALPFAERDLALVERLHGLAESPEDAKADALSRLLRTDGCKTIVFTDALATTRHLAQRLQRVLRVATIDAAGGRLGADRASRTEVLAAFAPRSQGADPPPRARETDVLIATDVLSEGLNLQDAARVIHYDVPWSPARLAQRTGRIDRLGSTHDHINVVTFLPPTALAEALQLEEKVTEKIRLQAAAGVAQLETVDGAIIAGASLDWCDRLQKLSSPAPGLPGCYATVAAAEEATVLIVRIGTLAEAIVVDAAGARADPSAATKLLEDAAGYEARPPDAIAVDDAVVRAAPLVRDRLASIADIRWRAGDRDRLSRRLIPWVLTAARCSARQGAASELVALDLLVTRLSLGMTAGEELTLAELVCRPEPLTIEDVRRWHDGLPPVAMAAEPPQAELVAAIVLKVSPQTSDA